MGDETKLWIARKHTKQNMLLTLRLDSKKAKTQQEKANTMISDGAPNFNDAFNREFYNKKNPKSRHIKHIRLHGDHNNNKMERMNGVIRDREKTMYGLKKVDTPALKVYQIYHNYIMEHQAFDGKTPAEQC